MEQILLVLDIFKTKASFGGLITDLKELQKIYARVEIVTKQLPPKLTQKGDELIVEDVTESQVNISTDILLKQKHCIFHQNL